MGILGLQKAVLRVAEENLRIKGHILDPFHNLFHFILLLFHHSLKFFDRASVEIVHIDQLRLSLCLFEVLAIHLQILMVFLDVLLVVLLQLRQPVIKFFDLALGKEVEEDIVEGRVPSALKLSLDFTQIVPYFVGLLLG